MFEALLNLPPALATILIAILPVIEIRGALPIALEVFQMPFWQAYLLAVLGNMIPAFALVYGLGSLTRLVENHSKLGKKLLDLIFARTERKLRHKYEIYGALALFLFTAIPLPFTGAWTASIGAVLFKIRPKAALPAIFAGVIVAGIIVGFLTGVIDFLV